MHEHNPDDLLSLIIRQGKRLTCSDAGFLLLAFKGETGPRLRLAQYSFDSLPDLSELITASIPVDSTSIIGHVALIRRPVAIADAYALPPDADFARNAAFDKRFGYRIRSMLLVPLIDRRDDVMGVLVFINRKTQRRARIRTKASADRYVRAYTRREMRLARSLASQAAVSIENATLYTQIDRLFESFVKACVSAIDQRDPSTAGHSIRVATLTRDLAAAVERVGRGSYRDFSLTRAQIRELHFAALLHDLGKVTVREDVLTKAKKLPPHLWERVDARFELIHRTMEVEYLRKRLALRDSAPHSTGSRELKTALDAELQQLASFRSIVRQANEPTLGPATSSRELDGIAMRTFAGPEGQMLPYLTSEELRYLRIPSGTLDEVERREIEGHVEQTYRFLAQIPWTDDLKHLASYAGMHHEKLDGSGYPRHVKAEDIPVQARLIAIADTFDALTEADRPYKPALPVPQALELLQSEARAGHLDAGLVQVLVDSQVYRKITEGDWHSL